MNIDCLLDTNSIVKRYHTETGSDIIEYLFDHSPSAVINLLNIQVVEVIKLFYKLRAEGKIESDSKRDILSHTFLNDIKCGKIKLYDFANEHLKDFGVYDPITQIQPDSGKKRSNTVDAIMLIVMREIHFMSGDTESFLVCADDHVLDVAAHLKIRTINPMRININSLPKCLDRRHRRICKSMKVVLKGPSENPCLGTGCTVDISEHGLAMGKQSSLTIGRDIELKLSPLHRDEPTIELPAKVVWSNKRGSGLKFCTPMSQDLFSQLILN